MIIKTDPDVIQSYLEDYSGLRGGHAEQVVVPGDEKELREFLRDASERRIPVTLSGGGTGVTGGRIPFGGILVSMERFDHITNIRSTGPGTAIATVQSGVPIYRLKEETASRGLLYAPDVTEQSSFIGGNVSTNASGSRGFKYGSTRAYIERIRVLLVNGDIIDLNRGDVHAGPDGILTIPGQNKTYKLRLPKYLLPSIKNAAGYYNFPGMDAVDLFIGQEGTLGAVTELDVRLLPMIDTIIGGVAFFSTLESAWAFAAEVKQRSHLARKTGAHPAINGLSLEYMDRNALRLLRDDYPAMPPDPAAAILFEQDTTPAEQDKITNLWTELLENFNVPLERVWFGAGTREQETFRDFRHRLPERVNQIVKRNGLPKVGTDIAVPFSEFAGMLSYYYEEFERFGMEYLVFGHIGDSHLHANLLPSTEEGFAQCREEYLRLVNHAIKLGGTASAEHGIGKIKHHFLERMVGAEGMRAMSSLKLSLDPGGILGRGNVFPESLLPAL